MLDAFKNMTGGNAKLVKKQEQRQPTVPDPHFVPGVMFTFPLKGQPATTLTIVIEAMINGWVTRISPASAGASPRPSSR